MAEDALEFKLMVLRTYFLVYALMLASFVFGGIVLAYLTPPAL